MGVNKLIALLASTLLANAASAQSRVEWVTLGTSGGPAVQAERSQIANALRVGDALYLFDTGNGVQRQMAQAGMDEKKVRAVFLSHHHLDHNADLGPLMVTHWTFGQGVLKIFGPAGTKTLTKGLVSANAPTMLAAFPTGGPKKPGLGETVKASDLSANMMAQTEVYQDENIRVWAITIDHFQMPPSVPLPVMPQAVAYRIAAGGKIIVYTGDTGPSARMEKLAKDADLLVSEIVEPVSIAATLRRSLANAPATLREGIVSGITRNHLTPDEVGKLAARAGVKALVLTHFVPSPVPGQTEAAWTDGIRAHFKAKIEMADDLERFEP